MRTALLSEFFGTAFLVMIVFGSGIMGVNLSGGNVALALLVNSIATGAGLFVLIQCLGTLSGAHLNPVVTSMELLWGRIDFKKFISYIFVQNLGAIAGVILTHLMFQQEILQISTVARTGSHLWISEIIATFGLICVVALAGKKHVELAPLAIALYITAGYWFTSSTCFANPAVTFARIFTNTFSGIAPSNAAAYINSQFAGAFLAYFVLGGRRHELP